MNKYIAFFLAVAVIIIVGVIFGLSSKEPKKLEEPQPTGAVRITNPFVIPQEKISQEDDGNNQIATVNTPKGVLIEAAVKFSFKDDEKGGESK